MWYKQGLREKKWSIQSLITQVEKWHLHQRGNNVTMLLPHLKSLCFACRLSVDQKYWEGKGFQGFEHDRWEVGRLDVFVH